MIGYRLTVGEKRAHDTPQVRLFASGHYMNNSVSIVGISQVTSYSEYTYLRDVFIMSQRSQGAEFVLAGASACGAITLTNPVDVVKTRLQLQGELRTGPTTTGTYTGRDLPFEMSCLFTVRGCWWYGKNQLKGLAYGCFKICKFCFSLDIEGCAFRRNWRYVSLRRCSRIGCYIFWSWHVTMIVVVILISLVCNAHLEIKESAV